MTDHFGAFLANKVNLSDSRIATLDARVESVSQFLSAGGDAVATNFNELIPQGSYAHRTIINPVTANDEFDADVLLDMDEVEGWEAEDYVENLYTAFRSSGIYRDMVSRKSRCVTVDYAGDFHMDVVPYLVRHGEHYITNRSENQYERTNPEGFNEWLDGQNRITGGNCLVKVIRLLKYLRDFKNTFSVKSVILTILIGERVSSTALMADPDHYKDLPTALLNLMIDLNDYLQANPAMPSIDDPSCPGESFNHRWNQEQYANFRSWVATYTEWARDAYDETDREESYVKWRKLFGDKFGTYSTAGATLAAAHRGLPGVRDTEEFIEDKFPVALNPQYRLKLQGVTVRRNGWRNYTLSERGNVVDPNRKIKFMIRSSNIPEPYEVWWKVRNVGPVAIEKDMIRGQVERDTGSRSRTEPASFRGNHYVEVYVVKGGAVVAMDRQSVIIR
ncbi:MAG: hypothetical protein KJ817_08625 [Actinobacteria bacterium]|nr:hypothetical protein [Actinomycetota bacterium]MBU4207469.1 hypothetical protein [Actinomycetota bacterium]MBU4415590.1 hypothetical protein [Actinomycetota bacterium]